METGEPLEVINQRLKDNFGIVTDIGDAIWRISNTTNVSEKRLTTHTEKGVELQRPEILEMLKYPTMQGYFVLEKLTEVPEYQQKELGRKISYEPVFFFQDKLNNPLPPVYPVAELVIYTLYIQMGHPSGIAKYKENYDTEKAAETARIYDIFFGNETDVSTALEQKDAIVVPSKFFGES